MLEKTTEIIETWHALSLIALRNGYIMSLELPIEQSLGSVCAGGGKRLGRTLPFPNASHLHMP